MATFLGFYKNNMTGDEFVAPVEAESRNDAEWMLARQYPAGIYSLLTIYARKEMERILVDVERWPGLPNKVQPSTEKLLARVRVSNHLPPLPQQQAQLAQVDGGRIAQVHLAAQRVDARTQELAMRLLNAQAQGTLSSSAPNMSNSRFASASDAKPAAPRAQSVPAAMPKAMPQQMSSGNRPSLITMLKAMKG